MATREVVKWRPEKGGWDAFCWDKNRRRRFLGFYKTFEKAAAAHFSASELVKQGKEIGNDFSGSASTT